MAGARMRAGRSRPERSEAMAWIALFAASVFEVAWAVGLKSDQWSRLLPAVLTLVNMVMSAVLLGFAMRSLPLGVTYAVWTGLGTVGTVVAGMIWYGEVFSVTRLICIGLILVGTLGLRLA
jgi:quaternary ammonium compound-resistance protein SugE